MPTATTTKPVAKPKAPARKPATTKRTPAQKPATIKRTPAKPATMSHHTVIKTLETVWKAIQKFDKDVPDVVIVTGRRRSKGEASTRGQHCADTWHTPGREDRLAEIVIFGERLGEGPEATIQTMLHEAAHAKAKKLGKKDTSNRNRYHNKVFAEIAEELTLEAPKVSGGPAFGYSDCTPTDKTRQVFKRQVELLETVCKYYVKPVLPELKTKRPKRFASCDCGQIPWSNQMDKFVAANGPLTHEACGQKFEVDGDLTDKTDLLLKLTGGEDGE